MVERAEVARAGGQLPIGLAVGATLTAPVKMGAPIRYADVALLEGQTIVKLRKEQDAL
jgi:predicted homoserine dehydrogenase-like protein